MKPNLEIAEKKLKDIASLLNTVLADEYVLYTKTRNAHWNIEGENFMEMHKFFESQYEALDGMIDDTAERVRALGHFAAGSLGDFLSLTHLSERKNNFRSQTQILQTLLADHETIIRVLRNDAANLGARYNDFGTEDFITGLMERHEKMAWMLRAYLA